MYKPRLYPNFSEVVKYRATGNVRGGYQGGVGEEVMGEEVMGEEEEQGVERRIWRF